MRFVLEVSVQRYLQNSDYVAKASCRLVPDRTRQDFLRCMHSHLYTTLEPLTIIVNGLMIVVHRSAFTAVCMISAAKSNLLIWQLVLLQYCPCLVISLLRTTLRAFTCCMTIPYIILRCTWPLHLYQIQVATIRGLGSYCNCLTEIHIWNIIQNKDKEKPRRLHFWRQATDSASSGHFSCWNLTKWCPFFRWQKCTIKLSPLWFGCAQYQLLITWHTALGGGMLLSTVSTICHETGCCWFDCN